MKTAKTQRLMSISVPGAGGRGNLETEGLREAFLSHLGFQCLWVVPSGRRPMERIIWLCSYSAPEVSRERSLRLLPPSPGKLAGISQAGLRFSASGVLGMVLEVQEDMTIASQHKDSDNHRPRCTARKLLFPPTLPAESLGAHKKASFILAASFIQCVIHPPTLAYSCACFLLCSKAVCLRSLGGQ